MPSTAAADMVALYAERKRLAKLGFTTDIGTLSSFTADCFLLIDTKIDELQAKELEKQRKKGRSRPRR
jgi:hypothetical protein